MNALLEHAFTRSTARIQWVVEKLLRKVDSGCGRAWFEPQEFSWTRELESGWREIRAELEQVLSAEQRIPTFQEVSSEQLPISSDPLWRTYFLAVMGERIEDHCRQCPQTAALLAKVPELGNAMFSILLPGKRIPLHTGLYKGLLRYHLALRVPAAATQCWIEVNGERRLWQEGRSLVFDDTWPHQVANETDEIRVVLFLDFARPLPPVVASINRTMIRLLGLTAFARRAVAFLNDPPEQATERRGALD